MTTALIVIIIVAVLAFKLVGAVIRFCDRNVGFLLVLKFLVGHHHGRTNATFFHAGTKITHPSGRASRWHHRPGYYRMGVRWGCIGVIGSGLYGYFTARTLTEVSFITAALLLVVYGQYRGYRAFKQATYRRGTLNPLRTAVAESLGMSEKAAIDSVSLRPDYASVTDGGARLGTIVLPDNWRPEQEELMRTLLESRLGTNIDLSFRTAKAPFTVEISRMPQPPKIAHLSDYLGVIEELPADKLMLGIDGRSLAIDYDMANEDPHFLCVAPSRRGKTRLLLLIASQVLAQGGEVTIIDPKRVGVGSILAGHPRAHVYSDPRNIEVMWKAIHDYRTMVEDRIDAVEADSALTFPRHTLIVDEISMFSNMSRDHWREIKDPKDSAEPPMWSDFKAVTYMGAQFAANIAVFGQEADLRIIPGLNQYGARAIAGYTKRTWDRLIGTTPVPVSPKARGRFMYGSLGNTATPIQTLLGTDEELRDLAFSGVATEPEDGDVITGEVVTGSAEIAA